MIMGLGGGSVQGMAMRRLSVCSSVCTLDARAVPAVGPQGGRRGDAAGRGDATTTEMDLKLGVDANARDEFDTPALFAAVASGSTYSVRVLLDAAQPRCVEQ